MYNTSINLMTLFIVLLNPFSAFSSNPFPNATPEEVGLIPANVERLAEIVDEYFVQDLIVGAELLVIKNKRTVLHTAVGWKDLENESPMQPDTIFNIRSMSKPMTGASAQILIDEGRLSLDDEVKTYIPTFADWQQTVTLTDMLTHKSGLPLTIITGGLNDYPDLQTMVLAAGTQGPQYRPGSRFYYSDTGTDCVGAIVEQVSGQLLNEFIQDQLLTPLDMPDSFSFTAGGPDNERWQRTASQYILYEGDWLKFWEPDGNPWYPFAWGSQTVYSTPVDYAKFLSVWMDDGVMLHGERLLSEEAIERTLTPVNVAKGLGTNDDALTGFPGLTTYYGQLASLYGRDDALQTGAVEVIGHSGSDGTFAWGFPEQDLMVFYFTQSRNGLTGLRIEKEIDRLLVHTDPVEIPEQYKSYVGFYQGQNEVIEVFVHNNHLALDVPSKIIFELRDAGTNGRWYWIQNSNLSVAFNRGDDGEVLSMRYYEGSNSVTMPKIKTTPVDEWRVYE